MKVVQLFNSGPAGERFSATEPTLKAAGFETETICPFGRPWNLFDTAHNALRGLDFIRAIYVLLFRRKVDLICAHLESAFFILILKRLFFFKVPVLIWEVPWSEGWWFREFISALAIPRAHSCVVFGTNQIQPLQKRFGDHIAVHFVPFFVDLDFYKPATDEPADSSNCQPYIWSCGLDPGRDFHTLISASAELPVKLIVKGPKELANACPGSSRVIFETAFLSPDAFRERYRRATVTVVSTKATLNASGVTSLLEALATGCATVVTDNPGLRDYLPPPTAGVVVPMADQVKLREALAILLNDPTRVRRLGEEARKFVERNFSRERHFETAAEAFRKTIAAGRKA